MSSVREPSLGPIVGSTSSKSCRLWIRGAESGDEKSELSEDVRTIGILAVTAVDGTPIPEEQQQAFYFRLHREYDRTGTFNIGEDRSFRSKTGAKYTLEPNTRYTVRLGSLALDDARDNDEIVASNDLSSRLPNAQVWIRDLNRLDTDRSECSFTTFPTADKIEKELRFLLGSCRYPGMAWKRKHSDRIFRPMLREYTDPQDKLTPRFTLMVGDQIYADMFNRFIPLGLADTYAEFQERYLTAFGSKCMRALLRKSTTYMILDDHEIEDNWTQDRIHCRKKRLLFNVAITAYSSYQWSHSSRNYGRYLYYSYECGGYPFFVMDGRTQRYKDDDEDSLDDNHLLGRPSYRDDDPSQLQRVCDWLKEQQKKRGDVPKFLVTASVFVPNGVQTTKGDKQKNKSDGWAAFPNTRRELLDTIVSHNVQNVVFLAGDIHCTNVSEMTFSGTPEAAKLKAFSITSSAFYWPFFFADGEPSHYVHDSNHRKTPDTFTVNRDVTMDYKTYGFTQEDNYCQVTVDKTSHSILVRVKDYDGDPVTKRRRKLEPRLVLAPW